MGAGASLLQEDKNKPADASDITSLEMGVLEIRRLRLLAQQNPGTEFDIESAKPGDASDITTLAKAQQEIARLRTLFRVKVPSLDRVKIAGELHWEEVELERVTKECQEVLLQSHELLKEINSVHIGQLAATASPTNEFAFCMQAVLTILRQFHKKYKKTTKWQTALVLLKNMHFLQMILDYPIRRVSSSTIGKLQKYLRDEPLNTYAALVEKTQEQEKARKVPIDVHRFAAARLMAWCRAVNHYATTVFPRMAKIKSLKQAIDDLKSPEEKVAERFTKYRQKGLQKLYRSLDKDSNGAVSFVEVQTFLARYNCLKTKQKEWREKINIAHDQARRIVGRGDVEGGYVCAAELEFDEFVAFMLTLLKVIFNKVDVNGDGVIALDEMKELLQVMYGPNMGLSESNKKDANKVNKKVKSMFKALSGKGKSKKGSKKHKQHSTSAKDGPADSGPAALEGVDQELFIDAMIDVLVLPANIKKRVLERLLTLSISDADWNHAKRAATLEYVQVAMASEVKVPSKAPSKGSSKSSKGHHHHHSKKK